MGFIDVIFHGSFSRDVVGIYDDLCESLQVFVRDVEV